MAQNSSKGNLSGQKPLNQMIENSFFAMHPYPIMFFETDKYYNEIAKKILPMLNPMRKLLHVPNQVLMRMALSVAAYLEDQCSHLGLWSAFIHRHRQLYGKWLPWYDTTSDEADYYEDEVNEQDIKFILWMILVSTEGTPVIVPDHEAVTQSAQRIFDLLKEEFEAAPANEKLVDFIYSYQITHDFYNLKNILRWMTSTCYLMCIPLWQMEQCASIRNSLLSVVTNPSDPGLIPYFESSYECVHMRFGPLALYPKDWFVLMRQQKGITQDNNDILEIESTPFYPFMVISNDKESGTLTLRSCRDIEYEVDKDSFADDLGDTLEPNDLLLTSLVKYKGHWMANGLTTELNRKESKKEGEEALRYMGSTLIKNNQAFDIFNLPDNSIKPKVNPCLAQSLKEAIADNNGDRIFFFADPKAALQWQNKMAQREIANLEMYLKNFGSEPVMVYVTEDYTTVTMTLVPTINDPSNPYFNAALAKFGIDWIYTKYGVLDEFVAYLVKHQYLTNLCFNPKEDQDKYSKLIEENLPFFATFMRLYPC